MTFSPEPLAALLQALDQEGYAFTTVTPATHHRVLARRPGEAARDLRDIFGWSLSFTRDTLPADLLDLLREGGALEERNGVLRSLVRVSSLSGRLFLHSAFPTDAADSVFFGPDTYRFGRFVEASAENLETPNHLVDLGAGAGPGGISAAGLLEPERISLVDINPQALSLACANALAAGLEVETVDGGLEGVTGDIDLIIANPPFIADAKGRDYRDGGEMLGAGLSLDWARQSLERLSPGGTMLLYTGSPIVAGEDRLLSALAELAEEADASLRYEELDPDIFGEELDQPAYAEAGAERIAAVGAVLTKG
ncbi:methyltransferase [Sphingomonas glaciei]|uniref:Methyltransferase n=1 Tax=Sphingomonas glaciei TaxID=2938948 RepID=A0ABY5MW20_9SPHN|nr:methyltransferase [Sphingomonas glaciei]UUR08174.1 methyltransferase [Sphingomonas glaciei]